jgi:hypothetical protein
MPFEAAAQMEQDLAEDLRRPAQRLGNPHHPLGIASAVLLQLAAHTLALIGAVNLLGLPQW